VILVLVVMLLAVTASVLSNTQFKLAGNIQFENVAINRASARSPPRRAGSDGPTARDGAFATYSTDTPYLYPIGTCANNLDPLTMTWSDSNSLAVGGSETALHDREIRRGQPAARHRPRRPASRPLTGCQKSTCSASAPRLSAKGTAKFLQTTYSVPSC
jgi:hypothetical protein